MLFANEAPITSRMQSSATSDTIAPDASLSGLGDGLDRIHRQSLSLARQCG